MPDLMPVAGDPLAIADAARAFESIAAQVAVTSAKLRALATANGTWSGTAATRANARTATLPPKLDKVRISYADAGSSLRAYAAALADAQQRSAAAIRAASAAEADLQSARAAQAAAAQRDTEQASATAASGLLPPPPVAPRYDVEISDASSRIARATAANAAAHDDQQRAARGAAARLRQASHEGIKNQPWWRHALSSAAHWASTSWANSLRFVSHVATTISALAGLAALVVSVAGVFFPPLEAAAAALEAISLVAGVMGAAADTALAATGKGSWTSVAVDAVGLAPWAGSALVRKAGRMLRNPATVVHASAGAMADGERVADAAAAETTAHGELSTIESWGDPRTLARHARDHGADFGSASPEEYAAAAARFLQDSRAAALPTKIDLDGVIRVYDPGTNTFGSYNPDGTSRTFFKPTSPTYWDRQPGAAPWSR